MSCEVVGQAKDGGQQTWAQPTTIQAKEGSTAAELSERVFKQAGIGADTGTGSYGWFLNSLTSPFDEDVKLSTEHVDASTWKFWQFFVNGKKANVGAGNYTLKAGDKVSWVYGSDGTMPGQAKASCRLSVLTAAVMFRRGRLQLTTPWLIPRPWLMRLNLPSSRVASLRIMVPGNGAGSSNSITSPFDGRTLAWDSTTRGLLEALYRWQAFRFGRG